MEPNQGDLLALATQQQARIQQLESIADKSIVDAALGSAIGAHPVIDHAREQVADLLRGGVRVITDLQGNRVAAGPGMQPVGQYVKEKLSSVQFAHFIRNAGPTAAPYAPGAADNQAPPKTLAEAFRRDIAEKLAAGPDGRTNLRLPMPMQPVPKKE